MLILNLLCLLALIIHELGQEDKENNIESQPTIMDKSLGTLLCFWGIFQFKQVQPLLSPHKQCWTHVSRIFSEFQLCIGWGERELQENFEKDALF